MDSDAQRETTPMNAKQLERLDYLSRARKWHVQRGIDSRTEESPCGPMGTAERLACESALQFEDRHGAELNDLLKLRAQALRSAV